MGQDEMPHSEHWKKLQWWFGIENKLTTILYKSFIEGERTMKPRKKLVSIALVILLICSMALPASAGSVEAVDRFEDCEFSMYTICNTHDFSSYMEFQHIYIPGSNKTYEDYSFRSEVLIYEAVGFGDGILLSTIPGTSSTMISSTR